MEMGNSLLVQWLGLCTSTAGGMDSICGQGTKTLHAVHGVAKKKKKKNHNHNGNVKLSLTEK